MTLDKKYYSNSKIINEKESSSSEDDADAVLLTDELEKSFLKVLSRLKKKDSKLYSENTEYFSSDAVHFENQNKSIGKQQDYKEWLKGHKKEVKDQKAREDLGALHNFWANPNINEDDQFLRDYILNKRFLDPDESFCLEKELRNLSEEEKEEEELATFEEKYNCRFENPDNKYFERFPQTMEKASGKKRNSFIAIPTEKDNMKIKGENETKKNENNVTPNKSSIKQRKRKVDEKLKNDDTDIKLKLKKKQFKKLTNNVSISENNSEKESDKKQYNMNTKENIKSFKNIEYNDSTNFNIGKASHLKTINNLKSNIKKKHKASENKVKVDKNVLHGKNFKEIFNLKKLARMKSKLGKLQQPKSKNFSKIGDKKKNTKEKKNITKNGEKLKEGGRKPRHRALRKKSVSK